MRRGQLQQNRATVGTESLPCADHESLETHCRIGHGHAADSQQFGTEQVGIGWPGPDHMNAVGEPVKPDGQSTVGTGKAAHPDIAVAVIGDSAGDFELESRVGHVTEARFHAGQNGFGAGAGGVRVAAIQLEVVTEVVDILTARLNRVGGGGVVGARWVRLVVQAHPQLRQPVEGESDNCHCEDCQYRSFDPSAHAGLLWLAAVADRLAARVGDERGDIAGGE